MAFIILAISSIHHHSAADPVLTQTLASVAVTGASPSSHFSLLSHPLPVFPSSTLSILSIRLPLFLTTRTLPNPPISRQAESRIV